MSADTFPPLEEDPNEDIPTEKTDLQQTAFYRIIMSVHDFVMFLRDLYVPDEAIRMPPEGGWPQITKETWTSLGKSDEVIEVLRHMTYIKPYVDPYQFLPYGGLCDWRSSNNVDTVIDGGGRTMAFMTECYDEPAPSHVVGLIMGGRSAPIVYLDCRDGLVYGNGDSEGGWEEGEKLPVEKYFALLKEQYRQMQRLPCSTWAVTTQKREPESSFKALKEIFTRHGWPDNYQKDQCVAELAEFESL